MANNALRQAARESGVKLWELADALDVSEATVTRMLRRELDAEKQSNLLEIINAIAQQKRNAATTTNC